MKGKDTMSETYEPTDADTWAAAQAQRAEELQAAMTGYQQRYAENEQRYVDEVAHIQKVYRERTEPIRRKSIEKVEREREAARCRELGRHDFPSKQIADQQPGTTEVCARCGTARERTPRGAAVLYTDSRATS
jgi:hypothetical protein